MIKQDSAMQDRGINHEAVTESLEHYQTSNILKSDSFSEIFIMMQFI